MGLGVHGGGIASAKWLLQNKAKVTVTDLRSENELKESINQFTPAEIQKITFTLGKHQNTDFIQNDIIIVNPAIPQESKYLKLARENKKEIQNDASLFFYFVKNQIIGVTGTRGKTTCTNWIAQLLSSKYSDVSPSGNNPDNAFLKEIMRIKSSKPVVAELSSWQLELLPASKKAPHIAIITNIYPDHLNRHEDMNAYANAKANIFKYQTKNDVLILNHDDKWSDFFLQKKPNAKLYFISKNALPENKNGLYMKNGSLIFRENNIDKKILSIPNFEKDWGRHNLENLLFSTLAVLVYDPSIVINKELISTLSGVRFRQETVYQDTSTTFINDTTATSPDALISAIERFAAPNTLFIVGGTDKKLTFAECARIIKSRLTPKHVVFLSGSATDKLLFELQKISFFDDDKPVIYDSLQECITKSYKSKGKTKGTIVFSPGASSFEKFNNEFHRGIMFEKYISEVVI